MITLNRACIIVKNNRMFFRALHHGLQQLISIDILCLLIQDENASQNVLFYYKRVNA